MRQRTYGGVRGRLGDQPPTRLCRPYRASGFRCIAHPGLHSLRSFALGYGYHAPLGLVEILKLI